MYIKNQKTRSAAAKHLLIELIEYILARIPQFAEIRTILHATLWPDQELHATPYIPGWIQNKKLLATDCTKLARDAIINTDIVIVLFVGDTAVPTENFLTVKDWGYLSTIKDSDDKIEVTHDLIIQSVKKFIR